MPVFSVNVWVGHPNGGKLMAVSAIVDSGAVDSMVPESLMATLGIEPTSEVVVQGDGGQVMMAHGCAKFRIFEEERICRVFFGPSDQVLLGASALDEFNLIIDGVNQCLLHGLEDKNFDVFIAHASEDKDEVARPLAEALRDQGLQVWFDEFEIKIGDSIAEKIGKGLADSRSGIVIFSPAYFDKAWPQFEAKGMITRLILDGYVIFPIWHKVTKETVANYNPSLADIWAGNTANTHLNTIAHQIAEQIKSSHYSAPKQ